MKSILFRMFMACGVLFLVSACSNFVEKTQVIDEKIEHVQAVLYHEGIEYTLVVKEGPQLVLKRFGRAEMDIVVKDVKLFDDVPAESEMWAHHTDMVSSIKGSDGHLEIHIHSAKDIDGAGWNHGKFGSGATTRLAP